MLFPAELLKKCWFLAGPTAVGKTEVAVALARQLGAEVVSMDSMAVYRGMDVGTAKPTPQERASIPHHLVDVADPHENYSVAEYVDAAESVAAEVIDRGRVPLFAGGTGLYLRSLLRGVFDGPSADWNLRRQWQSEAIQRGDRWLLDQLKSVDPVSAARLHPRDQRRIIRALEVHALTGRPLSEQQTQHRRADKDLPAVAVWLVPPRGWLRDRIDRRVDRMMQAGLLDETRRLLASSPPPGRTARQALGYRELMAHLELAVPLDACVEQIRVATRQFAKRQHTWFRNLDECTAISITDSECPQEIAARILEYGDRHRPA